MEEVQEVKEAAEEDGGVGMGGGEHEREGGDGV